MEMINAPSGADKLYTIFVFHEEGAFRRFVTIGLNLSGTANAAPALTGVSVYQLTDSGLRGQPLIQGTQYCIDYTLPHTPEPGEIVGSADRKNMPSQR